MKQQLNKAIIQGIIGSFRIYEVNDKKVVNMSVCTSEIFKDKTGNVIEEVTWHQIQGLENDKTITRETIENIDKGKYVKVEGKIKNMKYTNTEGNLISCMIIAATGIELI